MKDGEATPQNELRAFSLLEIPIEDYEQAKQSLEKEFRKQSDVSAALRDVMGLQRQRALESSDHKPISE